MCRGLVQGFWSDSLCELGVRWSLAFVCWYGVLLDSEASV